MHFTVHGKANRERPFRTLSNLESNGNLLSRPQIGFGQILKAFQQVFIDDGAAMKKIAAAIGAKQKSEAAVEFVRVNVPYELLRGWLYGRWR